MDTLESWPLGDISSETSMLLSFVLVANGDKPEVVDSLYTYWRLPPKTPVPSERTWVECWRKESVVRGSKRPSSEKSGQKRDTNDDKVGSEVVSIQVLP